MFFILVAIAGGSIAPKTTSNKAAATGKSSSSISASTQVDKTKLNNRILSLTTNYKQSDYTADSWAVYAKALQQAQDVNNKDDATSSDVSSALSALETTVNKLEKPFNPDEYQAGDYKSIARKPDDFKGKKMTMSGKVIQVLEGSKETDLRIATTGSYDDVILVGFDQSILKGTHVLEGDTVTIYGVCNGLTTYSSTMGKSISIPGFAATQVVIH